MTLTDKEIIKAIINDATIFASKNKIENIDEYCKMLKCWKDTIN